MKAYKWILLSLLLFVLQSCVYRSSKIVQEKDLEGIKTTTEIKERSFVFSDKAYNYIDKYVEVMP